MKFEELPPEVKEQIRVSNVLNNYNMYGRQTETYSINGELYDTVKSDLSSIENPRTIDDFIQNEEGCETWTKKNGKREEYPMRGTFPNDKTGDLVKIKNIITTIARTLKTPIDLIYIYFNWKHYLDFMHRSLQDVYFKDFKDSKGYITKPAVTFYSQPVRAIYRAMNWGGEVIGKIKDVWCAVLEFDTAYRYRVQAVLPHLDKGKLHENPIKELKRLAKIMIEKENWENQGTKKFKNKLWILWLFLRVQPKVLQTIVNILNRVDLDEVKLSKEDIYWTKQFSFGFKFYE